MKDPPRYTWFYINSLTSFRLCFWFVTIGIVFLKVADPDASSDEAQMANEYEKLSQMCLKQNKYIQYLILISCMKKLPTTIFSHVQYLFF
jgi:hypothetical protein